MSQRVIIGKSLPGERRSTFGIWLNYLVQIYAFSLLTSCALVPTIFLDWSWVWEQANPVMSLLRFYASWSSIVMAGTLPIMIIGIGLVAWLLARRISPWKVAVCICTISMVAMQMALPFYSEYAFSRLYGLTPNGATDGYSPFLLENGVWLENSLLTLSFVAGGLAGGYLGSRYTILRKFTVNFYWSRCPTGANTR